MTINEAIDVMCSGGKVTHRYFSSDEYIWMPIPNIIETEEGYRYLFEHFMKDRMEGMWATSWSKFVE